MALPLTYTNVEPSFRNRGEYVGYGQGVWRVHRNGAGKRSWRALRLSDGMTLYGHNLHSINQQLIALNINAGNASANVKLPRRPSTT